MRNHKTQLGFTRTPKSKTLVAGFTLIELLVVIAILGLLASIVMTSLGGARKKARDTRRITDVRQMDTALQFYVQDQGHAPYLGALHCSADLPDEECTNDLQSISDYEPQWLLLQTDLSAYISRLPKDPCGQSCPGADSSFFVYYYVHPDKIASACGSCGLGTSQLDQMYVIGALNLESTENPWTINRSWNSSF